jgi:general stress protein 26
MNMQDVREFMRKVGWGMLATGDGRVVGVRPMGGLTWFDGEIWCATHAGSDKTAQLAAAPYGEYCFAEPTGRHLRIAGPCRISTDDADKARLYEAVPILARYFPDPKAPEFVVLRMTPERVRMMSPEAMGYEEIAPDRGA